VIGGRTDERGLTGDGGADGGLAKAARPAQHSQCELQNVNYYYYLLSLLILILISLSIFILFRGSSRFRGKSRVRVL
jgi:hypothetical protein